MSLDLEGLVLRLSLPQQRISLYVNPSCLRDVSLTAVEETE